MNHLKLFLSFFHFSFFIWSTYSSSYSSSRCSLIQTHALLLFKQNVFSYNNSYDEQDGHDNLCHNWLGSDYYPIMMNWNMSIDCCNWDGVTCDHSTGDVIALDLSCGMLRGTIHPNSTLFNLPHLQRLNLAFNDLTDSHLPSEIGRFSNSLTHLNISDCGFIGHVPNGITFLRKLVSLDISSNRLDFVLEPHVLTNLLLNSTLLKELSLASVSISSNLPTHLNISSSLKSLDLRYTRLQGKLPDNIFNLQNLEKLDLSRNADLIIGFPKFNASTSTPLKWLDLSSTSFSKDTFNSIGHLKSLNYLDLSYTKLSGETTYSIGHLKYLNYLDLSYTNLSGDMIYLFDHLKSLNYLDLSSTKLSGEIKYSTGHLKSLNYLDLSAINISSEAFNSICDLRSLNTLLLTSCGLKGPLPKSLSNLSHLTSLDLSYNMLNGTLPSWLFTHLSLETISLASNMFSGSLPSEFFNHDHSLKEVYLGANQFDGEIDVLNQSSTIQTFQQLINLAVLDLESNKFTGVWELDTLLSSLTRLRALYLSDSGLSVVTNNDTHYDDIHFTVLSLASCKLTVFPNFLRAMKKIVSLDLSNNEIRGHIPDWAAEIGGDELLYLDLSYNFITGLPQFQWSRLQYFLMQSNLIQGTFPPSICNMSMLRNLDMSNNSFGGVIPQCFGNFSSSLQTVDLGNNGFYGTIPNTFKDCGQLEGIILNGNQLEGQVPNCLSKCESLKVLDLGNNHLNDTFPHWSGHLAYLQVLVLKSNKLHGPIEKISMIEHPFPSLIVLDLSQNEFAGHLSKSYFQNFDAMKNVIKKGTKPEYLSFGSGKFYSIIVAVKGVQLSFPKILVDYTIVDLSNNIFEGEIPDVIGSLNSLLVLNLSHNNPNGGIPRALGNLSEIQSLDLSWNRLTGEIPQSLAAITTLAVLNLSQNNLVGRIPSGTQFSTFSTSFGGNLGLCGFPLPTDCRTLSTPQLEVDGEKDEESGLPWNVVMLGYGCGTIIGMVLGYLMLSTGRPKWFNAITDELEHMVQTRQNMRRYIYFGKEVGVELDLLNDAVLELVLNYVAF